MAKYDVCMLGLGPVGTVSGLGFAKQGFKIIGVDIDKKRVAALMKGKAPFVEPGVDELAKAMRKSGHFTATTNLKEAVGHARIIMIAVGTPTLEGHAPDLSQLDNACAQIGEGLKQSRNRGAIIVVRSTVPPGTMRTRLAPIIEKASGMKAGKDFFVAANPEFLREGIALQDFFHTSRIVIGADEKRVADQIAKLYHQVEAGQCLAVSLESAEFAKYVDNTWHALKVSFANEIGRVGFAFGGQVEEISRIFLADNVLNISKHYLRPGFAFGGSCLPKDVRGLSNLAKVLGVRIPIVEAILPSNEEQVDLGVDAVMQHNPKKVGILGIAFKEHVDDLRESPALTVAYKLRKLGVKVQACDPAYKAGMRVALKKNTRLQMEKAQNVVDWADTLVVMHNIPVYLELARKHAQAGGKVIYMTKLLTGPRQKTAKGFTFIQVPKKPLRSATRTKTTAIFQRSGGNKPLYT